MVDLDHQVGHDLQCGGFWHTEYSLLSLGVWQISVAVFGCMRFEPGDLVHDAIAWLEA